MQSSPFDFDVVAGPSLPADKDKPKPPNGGSEKPSAGAAVPTERARPAG